LGEIKIKMGLESQIGKSIRRGQRQNAAFRAMPTPGNSIA